jgi:hypothetical protein
VVVCRGQMVFVRLIRSLSIFGFVLGFLLLLIYVSFCGVEAHFV